jgi:hypothetical protein
MLSRREKTRKNISYLVIVILVAIILLQRSCTPTTVVNGDPEVTVKIDTVYKNITDTVIKTVPVKSVVYVKPEGPHYVPTDDIDTCKANFDRLLNEHIKKTVYQDTLKLDNDFGTITVIDTVWINKLYGKRTYIQNINIPTITKTITKPEEPKRQIYIGANLFGDKKQLQVFTPGILYKTKKDHIYQANLGVNFDGSITYGGGMYWKISFKK